MDHRRKFDKRYSYLSQAASEDVGILADDFAFYDATRVWSRRSGRRLCDLAFDNTVLGLRPLDFPFDHSLSRRALDFAFDDTFPRRRTSCGTDWSANTAQHSNEDDSSDDDQQDQHD